MIIRGIKQIWNWKFDKRLYIGLGITTIFMIILQFWTNRDFGAGTTIFCYFVYLFILGIIRYTEDKKKLIKDVKEKKIFDIIDVKNLDGSYPNIYKTLKAKDGRVIYFIYTNAPLFEWKGKKRNIETAFGAKVLEFGYGYTKNLIKISTVSKITKLIIIQINLEKIFGADRDIRVQEKKDNKNMYIIYSSNIIFREYENKKEHIEQELNLKIISMNELDKKNIEIEFSKLDTENTAEKKLNTDNIININPKIDWNFRESPNALVYGSKNEILTILEYLIKCILEKDYYLKIIDSTRSDMNYLDRFEKIDVVYKKESILNLLKESAAEMNNRYDEFKELENYGFRKDYYDYGYKPIFIIFDEVVSFMCGSAEENEKKQVQNYLLDIINQGIKAGIFVIITAQTIDKILDKSLIKQLGLRIALGKKEEDYTAIFDIKPDFKIDKFEDGYIFINNKEFEKFGIPKKIMLTQLKSKDFIQDIKSIMDKSK